jgi:quinol monooxygenase YgiN
MIVIHARVRADAATVAALRAAVTTMEQASRAETGCVDYTFAVELTDPTTIRIVEEWASVDALKAHFATPHMAAFQAAMRAHPPKGIDVKMFEAQEVPFPAL